jgi:hypothetical protein
MRIVLIKLLYLRPEVRANDILAINEHFRTEIKSIYIKGISQKK